jgi:hypothetical protein
MNNIRRQIRYEIDGLIKLEPLEFMNSTYVSTHLFTPIFNQVRANIILKLDSDLQTKMNAKNQE